MDELDIRMDETPGGLAATYKYEFRSTNIEGTGPLVQEYVVDPNPALVGILCDKIDKIVREAREPASAGADPAAELAQTSQLLFTTLFPSSEGHVSDLAQRLDRTEGPLLIRTNESLIPWELLHDGNEFIALAHDIGRRTFVS